MGSGTVVETLQNTLPSWAGPSSGWTGTRRCTPRSPRPRRPGSGRTTWPRRRRPSWGSEPGASPPAGPALLGGGRGTHSIIITLSTGQHFKFHSNSSYIKNIRIWEERDRGEGRRIEREMLELFQYQYAVSLYTFRIRSGFGLEKMLSEHL